MVVMKKTKFILGFVGGVSLLFASISLSTLVADNAYADAARGEKVFFESEDAECNSCHKLKGRGGSKKKKEPDLSNIGNQLSRDEIFTKITNPCMRITDGYRDSYEEEVMPRNFVDLLPKQDISDLADFLATMKDTSVDTPKSLVASAEDQEEYCE